ncbi:MAG: hypothetical protein IJB74_00400 [Clostridia bacterium]|nr:hypothetical protein [Clostridia bacterium]
MPIIVDYDELSDSLIDLKDASFGATCSTATTTLSDKYIDSRIAENPENAKYISPDRMVDLSTGYFPETNWIVKNSVHSTSSIFDKLCVHFLSHKNLTVHNDSRVAQFSMFDKKGTAANCYVVPMTKENCGCFEWLNTGEKKSYSRNKACIIDEMAYNYPHFINKAY